MFDWSKVNGNTPVHCKTEEEAKQFLKECENHSLTWFTNKSLPTERTNWEVYKAQTVYYPDKKGMTYGDIEYAIAHLKKVLEYSELCKPDLPRICYILGGEDRPLKPFEKFKIDGILNNPHHFSNDMSHLYDCAGSSGDFYIAFIIDHPEKIIRQPQFSEDEKALMRLCGENGYWGWYRDEFGVLHVKEFDEAFGLIVEAVSMKGITKEYTKKNPFNAAEYLEGLK